MHLTTPSTDWIEVPNDPKGDSAHLKRFAGKAVFRYWPESRIALWRGRIYKGVHPDDIDRFVTNRTDLCP